VQEIATRARRSHSATRSLKDDQLNALFKLTNATTQRRLAKKQRIGRAAKASVVCGRQRISEMHEVDSGWQGSKRCIRGL
jgi:hypothetical protein